MSADAQSQEAFKRFAERRKEMEHLLDPSERWLTPDDILQPGDAYAGGSGKNPWWEVDGVYTSLRSGVRVPVWIFCYIPKGSKKRR